MTFRISHCVNGYRLSGEGRFQAAADMINDHKYGSGMTIFTRDGSAAREFAHRIEGGMAGVHIMPTMR